MSHELPRQIGPYLLGEEIGRGGMGVVHRARDTRLGRDVAVKSMPTELGDDPARLERFEREARILAGLSHPNIAVVHGLEEVNGRRYLVMELVQGETLFERLKRGRMAIEEVTAIALQIADALKSAHASGVVHRDLKPANIVIGEDDRVKVLDFGLAKAAEGLVASASSQSPTLDAPHSPTIPGAILGTVGYMAPEQARGRAADHRADIWAFGCILYEMLAGRPPFGGETVTDALASTLQGQLDLSKLPAGTPTAMRRLVRRCLARDRNDRLQDMGDARLELVEVEPESAVPARSGPGSALAILGAAVLVLAAAVGFLLVRGQGRSNAGAAPIVRFDITPPPGTLPVVEDELTRPVISPDGSAVLFIVAVGQDTVQLAMRRIGDSESLLVPGTEGAVSATFSPDGRSIAFSTASAVQRRSLAGGTVETVAQVRRSLRMTWLDDGTLVGVDPDGLSVHAIPAGGGSSRSLWQQGGGADHADVDRPWGIERLAPVPGRSDVVLAGGWNGSTVEDAGVYAIDVATGATRLVLDKATSPCFIGDDILVVQRRASLYAVRFDVAAMATVGEVAPVLDGIRATSWAGDGDFAISSNGNIAYNPGRKRVSERRIVRWNTDGTTVPLALEREPHAHSVSIAPDQRRALINTLDDDMELWLVDLDRDRWVSLARGSEFYYLCWFTDGRRAVLMRQAELHGLVMLDLATGVMTDVPLDASNRLLRLGPGGVLADGRIVAVSEKDGNVYAVDSESGAVEMILADDTRIGDVAVHRDGSRLAFSSRRDGGDRGVYVTTHPAMTRAIRVDTRDGSAPIWRPDSDELYLWTSGGVAVATATVVGGEVAVGEPKILHAMDWNGGSTWASYDVLADGAVVAVEMAPWEVRSPLRFVVGWAEEVRAALRRPER